MTSKTSTEAHWSSRSLSLADPHDLGDPERFQEELLPKRCAATIWPADSAHRDEDNYIWIMGRNDDVLKVSGHRLGTMEIESALVANPLVAEAAWSAAPTSRGRRRAFVVLKSHRPDDAAQGRRRSSKRCANWVGKEIGPIAKPDESASVTPAKTRSGKIMRRLLRSIAQGQEITQDVSTWKTRPFWNIEGSEYANRRVSVKLTWRTCAC